MIDTQDAQELLRLFRISLVDDKHAFHTVAHLRRSVFASETELGESLGVSSQVCKSLLRTLHQAGLVSVRHDHLFRLTSKGEFLSDQLGISSVATHSIINSFKFEPLDQAFLEAHLSFEEEAERAAIGRSLLWYQSLAVNAAWCSRVISPNVARRAAHALAVVVPWSRIGQRDRVDVFLGYSRGEVAVVKVKPARKHFLSRLKTAEADATLCDHFTSRGELPSSRDARTMVLLVTASRILAALLGQNSNRLQTDQALQWSIRRNSEVGKQVCAELVKWDQNLIESDLGFSGHRRDTALGLGEYRSRDHTAQALFAALSGVFVGAVIPLVLGLPIQSQPQWPCAVAKNPREEPTRQRKSSTGQ